MIWTILVMVALLALNALYWGLVLNRALGRMLPRVRYGERFDVAFTLWCLAIKHMILGSLCIVAAVCFVSLLT